MITSKVRKILNKDFIIFGDDLDKSVYNNILSDGDYENHMVEFYNELLDEDSVCIDAGANIGILSMYLSTATKGMIYAFEPAMETYEMLVKNVEVNKMNVTAINKALGNYTGKINFAFNKFNNGNGSLMPKNQEHWYEGAENDKRQVDIITLDDYIKENKIEKLDLLKMDVEGFETHILEGAKETLEKFRPDVTTEYCPPMIRDRELSSEKYFDMLKEYYNYIYFINRPEMYLVLIHNHEQLENTLKGFHNIGDVLATNKKL